jgi:hypothetical protein
MNCTYNTQFFRKQNKTWHVVRMQTIKQVMFFYENTRRSIFVCGHDILTDGVFVTELYGILTRENNSLTNCVGYNEMLWQEP